MNNKEYIIWIRHPKTAGTSIRTYFLNPENLPKEENKGIFYTNDGEYLIQLTNWYAMHNKKIEKNKVICVHTRFINDFIEKYESIWENSYKFFISRNPYDRFVSSWKAVDPTRKIKFTDMCNYNYNLLNTQQYYHIKTPQTHNIIENNVIFDYIVNFENLEEDFYDLLDLINIPKYKLPYVNKTNHKNYEHYYNETLKDFVYNEFKDDFDYFEYKK